MGAIPPATVRLGIDENGLGPRLGPLVVTAVAAVVDPNGARRLARPLPKSLRSDLDDSKVLLSTRNFTLGEAWARAVVAESEQRVPTSPRGLLSRLSLASGRALKAECPRSTERQCFHANGEGFAASDEELARVLGHLRRLERWGIRITGVRSEILCTGRLNRLKAEGIHRFAADLHGMERLILHFRQSLGRPVEAVCGKVGGIGKYEPYFGPLSGHLKTALEEGRERSIYHFPSVGLIRFEKDADGADPLVMLASLVGKYVRELLMGRIARFYSSYVTEDTAHPSGYHDPVTARFVEQTAGARRKLSIVDDCFERLGAD